MDWRRRRSISSASRIRPRLASSGGDHRREHPLDGAREIGFEERLLDHHGVRPHGPDPRDVAAGEEVREGCDPLDPFHRGNMDDLRERYGEPLAIDVTLGSRLPPLPRS